MTRSVNDRHRCVGDAELFPIFEALVGDSGMGLLPQHLVTGMDEDPRVQFFCQLWRHLIRRWARRDGTIVFIIPDNYRFVEDTDPDAATADGSVHGAR